MSFPLQVIAGFPPTPPSGPPPPQLSVQPTVEQVHFASPSQFTVQPPSAQITSQTLVPVQSSFDEGWSVTSQVLPPPHVTVEPAPVVTLQVLVPSHCAVELSPML